MIRTRVLQEIRRMRFKEARGGWQERRLSQDATSEHYSIELKRVFRRLSRVSHAASWRRPATRGEGGRNAWRRRRAPSGRGLGHP